jgi:hypothetical protein
MALDQRELKPRSDVEAATEIREANCLFFEQAQQLPGILRVEPCRGETLGDQAFRVYFRENDLDAEYSIYQLKGKIYDRYPLARLDVTVFEAVDTPPECQTPGEAL